MQVLSDVIAAGDAAQAGSYPHALLGDLCCLVGAALYAMSNVMQEFLVKAHDPVSETHTYPSCELLTGWLDMGRAYLPTGLPTH